MSYDLPSALEYLQPGRSALLDLPFEIRVSIYQELFRAPLLALDLPYHKTSAGCRSPICTCDYPWQITTCCRQTRTESLPLLHSTATLTLQTSFDRARLIPRAHLSAIPRVVVLDAKAFSDLTTPSSLICSPPPIDFSRLLPRSLSSLRLLELRNLTIWCQWNHETYLESEEANDSMFNLAMFNLQRNSPRLMSLCKIPYADNCENEGSGFRNFRILLCCQYVGSSLRHETVVRWPYFGTPRLTSDSMLRLTWIKRLF